MRVGLSTHARQINSRSVVWGRATSRANQHHSSHREQHEVTPTRRSMQNARGTSTLARRLKRDSRCIHNTCNTSRRPSHNMRNTDSKNGSTHRREAAGRRTRRCSQRALQHHEEVPPRKGHETRTATSEWMNRGDSMHNTRIHECTIQLRRHSCKMTVPTRQRMQKTAPLQNWRSLQNA